MCDRCIDTYLDTKTETAYNQKLDPRGHPKQRRHTYSMQAESLAPTRQRKAIHTASPLKKKRKMLIPAAQQLLALPAEIDLQRRRPYINKGDLAARGSRINSLCMKPLETHSSLACKTLLL